MNILIVEDEAVVAMDIAQQLEALGYTIDAIADTGEDALMQAHRQMPDLVLMDICLKGKMDGIQTAALLRRIAPTPIIYLTALSDKKTVARARDTEPEAYLLKPFNEQELSIAIELALYKASKNNLAQIEGKPPFYSLPDRLFVRSGNGFDKLLLCDLLYLEAERAYCKLYCTNRSYVVSNSLAEVLRSWQCNDIARIHKSYAVNTKKITRIEEQYVHLDNIPLPLGVHYKDGFLHQIKFL